MENLGESEWVQFELNEIETPVRYSCVDIQEAIVHNPGTLKRNDIRIRY